jgi:hypothetical protein
MKRGIAFAFAGLVAAVLAVGMAGAAKEVQYPAGWGRTTFYVGAYDKPYGYSVAASVFADGFYKGATPISFTLSPYDQHTIKASYYSCSQTKTYRNVPPDASVYVLFFFNRSCIYG